ncbi:hypothetical protein [Occallatibacter riparius]|uniref:Uncharacterized protein n=1 Tax=Occallatibacter riparius TaxID=1002689 RepID=A0A9J7BTV4_9BACT|nr:hypothetical protein [Occallatibacter riparius]UWZ86323.1 hypothetical protein MOP44_10340 [Occallatibacter riparius]
MARFAFLQPVLRVVFAVLLVAVALPAVGQKTLPLKQGAPGVQTNHRLILKDGSYQIVRKYEIVGDRCRYISVERSGEWEEMPADLIDWDATKKWDRDHVEPAYSSESEGMKAAEELDKEEAARRAEQDARMPQVAPGLELPDQDAVFALDTFQGTPELVELQPAELAVDAKTHHGLSSFNPMAAAKASIELPGSHAKVHLHVNDPAIYLSLDLASDAEAASHSMTVYTGGSKEATNRKRGAHSTQSGFAIVRVSERNKVRIIGALHISRSGDVSQEENLVPTKVEVLPGKHWIKVTPAQPLEIGDYALVEILSPTDINQTVWDFRVNPMLGDNTGSLTPILKQNSDRQ